MVSQKEVSHTTEVVPDGQPEDPSRRQFIKLIGGAGLFVAGGGTIWAINKLSEPEGPVQTVLGADPNVPVGNGPASTVAESPSTSIRETVSGGSGKEVLSGVSIEDLPTSLEDPEIWMNKIYNFFDSVYNNHNYEVLNFVYYNGLEGNLGEALRYDAEIVRITKSDESTDDSFSITGKLVQDRTTAPSSGDVVSVEQRILFKNQDIHRIMDYRVTQKVVYLNIGGATEEMTLYLISGAEEFCVFNQNGVCA